MGEAVLSYLRGDRSNETTENRAATLSPEKERPGGISSIHGPVYTGKPSATYSGYLALAIQASWVSTRNGRPWWWWAQTTACSMPSTPRMAMKADASCLRWSLTPSSRGGWHPESRYSGHCTPDLHRYFMNATPEIRDVDFLGTGGRLESFPSGCRPIETPAGGWAGQGGGASFAMDVTHIPASASESDVAPEGTVEFTHPDMGFSFGDR